METFFSTRKKDIGHGSRSWCWSRDEGFDKAVKENSIDASSRKQIPDVEITTREILEGVPVGQYS